MAIGQQAQLAGHGMRRASDSQAAATADGRRRVIPLRACAGTCHTPAHLVEERKHLGAGLVDDADDGAALLRQAAHSRHDIEGGGAVQPRGRLVQEDELGRGDQLAANGHAAALAAAHAAQVPAGRVGGRGRAQSGAGQVVGASASGSLRFATSALLPCWLPTMFRCRCHALTPGPAPQSPRPQSAASPGPPCPVMMRRQVGWASSSWGSCPRHRQAAGA